MLETARISTRAKSGISTKRVLQKNLQIYALLQLVSVKGERDTVLGIDSHNKHTHSYTVQPMVGRDGCLFPIALIVTQEDEGTFGPKLAPEIREIERKFGNIEVFASKSGKLTSALIDQWYHGTLFTAIKAKQEEKMADDDDVTVLILADSWSGHAEADQQRELRSMGAHFLQIPPGTTDQLQPLDVNFN